MNYVIADFGISPADAEQICLAFDNDKLILSFIDWREKSQKLIFEHVLAFRWQAFDENDKEIRDDTIYEVKDSEWLSRQLDLQGVDSIEYVHYKFCFNAQGSLDVLAKRYKS